MARLPATLAAVCLALLLCGPLDAGVWASTAILDYRNLWVNISKAINCFVVPYYRITNGVWDTVKIKSAGACFKRCAANYNTESHYQCLSWTFNKNTRRCSMSQAYINDEDGNMPNWVPTSTYVSGYFMDSEDCK